MNQNDLRFSSIGLLTYRFQMEFKKVLLFLEMMDDPELLYYISCFLDIKDLLALLATCKKLNNLKTTQMFQIRILRLKIKVLQSPKQALSSLCLLPAYYQFLLHQKQDEKQVARNTEVFFKNFKQYKRAKEAFKKSKQLPLRLKSEQLEKLIEDEKKYEIRISKIQRQIQENGQIYKPTQLSKLPQKRRQKQQSYVQKFREQYVKVKQFQRRRNIQELESLHKKQSQKVRIKKRIQTPFKTIPIIQIKNDQRISVIQADSLYKTPASKFLNRFKAIFGLNVYD